MAKKNPSTELTPVLATASDAGVSSLAHAPGEQSRTSRRDLLRRAGLVAGAAGGLALLAKQPVEAANGGNFILGQANAATSPTVLTSTGNPGLKVVDTTAGAVAIQGNTAGNTSISLGIGVLGKAAGSGWAVVGQAAAAGADLAANGSGRLFQNNLAAGPPAFTSFSAEQIRDVNGQLWLSNAAGGWMPAAIGGLNTALFTSVITTQPTQTGSNGVTWVAMAGGPTLSITPKFPCQAVISVNVDLFTDTSGINQDIGIAVSGGGTPTSGAGYYPSAAGQPEAWKESGGSAGIFSPNAAYLETVIPLRAGRAYTFTVVWKSNKPAPGGSKIWAGAGPIGGKYSPTRLTARLVPDTHTNTGIAPVAPKASKHPRRPN